MKQYIAQSGLKKKKLGQILMEHDVISQEQLVKALSEQEVLNAKSKRYFKLGEILLFLKWINTTQLMAFLNKQGRSTQVKNDDNSHDGQVKKLYAQSLRDISSSSVKKKKNKSALAKWGLQKRKN